MHVLESASGPCFSRRIDQNTPIAQQGSSAFADKDVGITFDVCLESIFCRGSNFLGCAMSTKPITAITIISKISDRSVQQSAALVVIYGEELGRKFDLDGKQITIGRSSKADIPIDQDSVSRKHVRIVSDGGKVTIKDLGSTNGTFVNDDAVADEVRLRNGDLIKVGRTIFKFLASNNIEAAYHDEVYRLTTVDGLTQVYNRRYFSDALERELSRSRRYQRSLSLILIDVDHFKQVNDRWGHLAGDTVLKGVAHEIRKRVRREDVLARYGGEEFSLLLPEVDIKGAALMAEKLRKLIEKFGFTFDDQKISLTISAGVAALKKSDDAESLLRRVDDRLYQAKHGGRNRVCS